MTDLALDKITEKIIGCAYKVSNALGIGFVEKVYENAHVHEMRKDGLKVEQQHLVKVRYDGIVVGEFYLDMLVNDLVIVELKAVSTLTNEHLAQAFNYLRATELPACLLINFGTTKIQIRRLYPSPTWKSPKS
ncbi:MAG TPA: GxxExxY protein [Anaerolineales bacterium]|nr:GxxExxY protein [Anaerolineales bacterium]